MKYHFHMPGVWHGVSWVIAWHTAGLFTPLEIRAAVVDDFGNLVQVEWFQKTINAPRVGQ